MDYVRTTFRRNGNRRKGTDEAKRMAVALVAAGAIGAFPASAGAQGSSAQPPSCERGQLTAFSQTQDFKHLIKFIQCAFGVPPRGI